MKKILLFCFLTMFIVLCCATMAQAADQGTPATKGALGTVTLVFQDANKPGILISEASIEMVGESSSRSYSFVTNASGEIKATLAPDTYKVTIIHPKYQTYSQPITVYQNVSYRNVWVLYPVIPIGSVTFAVKNGSKSGFVPISGAYIEIVGENLSQSYSFETNASGEAEATAAADVYDVTVLHSLYKTVNISVEIHPEDNSRTIIKLFPSKLKSK